MSTSPLQSNSFSPLAQKLEDLAESTVEAIAKPFTQYPEKLQQVKDTAQEFAQHVLFNLTGSSEEKNTLSLLWDGEYSKAWDQSKKTAMDLGEGAGNQLAFALTPNERKNYN